ncbi:MAG: RNA polymerase subunit sigma-70, partial [Planctomycetes bacterium]|nr:RNA polymerase subunit sigma-70 [Planctomycetota bacterium]
MDTGLQTYLRRINQAPLLTAEQEEALSGTIRHAGEMAERFQAAECTLVEKEDSEQDARVAREQMVECNLRLVVTIAKQYLRRGMVLSDLVEEGNL